MGATQSSDKAFQPKVWNDFALAYFDRKMGLGALAAVDDTLKAKPGETVNFPYFKAVGAAEKPAQTDSLQVDRLRDDAFNCTVYEIGKAVGWKAKARRVSAATPTAEDQEALSQIGRVIAEQVDVDLIAVMNGSGAYVDGLIQTGATDTCNVRDLLKSKIIGFGDKQDKAVAIVMHSLDFMNMMADSTAGFLSALATDPLYDRPGFMGRILGCALFVLDTVPRATDIVGKKAYYHFIMKANPYGFIYAEDLNLEKDRDILAREDLLAGTMWIGVTTLHAKIASNDYRVTRGLFSTNVAA